MTFHVVAKPGCPFCDKAKALLEEKGEPFEVVTLVTERGQAAFKAAGHKTYPQIWKADKHIGGFTDLEAWFDAQDDNF